MERDKDHLVLGGFFGLLKSAAQSALIGKQQRQGGSSTAPACEGRPAEGDGTGAAAQQRSEIRQRRTARRRQGTRPGGGSSATTERQRGGAAYCHSKMESGEGASPAQMGSFDAVVHGQRMRGN